MGLFSFIGKAVGAIGGTLLGIGPGAGAAIGGTLGGLADGSKSKSQNSNAITNAANAQIGADQNALGALNTQFGQVENNFNPIIASGNSALGQIDALLGLGQPSIAQTWAQPGYTGANGGQQPSDITYHNIAAAAPANVDWAAFVNANPGFAKQWAAQTPDLAPFGGDINKFGAFSYENNLATNPSNVLSLAPFMTSPAQQQQSAISSLQNSPLYQSLFGNGVNTVLSNASATGGLRGGNVNRSLANFGRDTLAQVIQQQLANLGGVQAAGQNAANAEGQFGANYATNQGNALRNIGDIQASAILGKQQLSNALANSNNNLFNSAFGALSSGSGGGLLGSIAGALGGGGSGGGLSSALGGLASGSGFDLPGISSGISSISGGSGSTFGNLLSGSGLDLSGLASGIGDLGGISF